MYDVDLIYKGAGIKYWCGLGCGFDRWCGFYIGCGYGAGAGAVRGCGYGAGLFFPALRGLEKSKILARNLKKLRF